MTTRLRKNGGVHQLIFVVLAALWLTVGARRVSATDWLMYGFNLQRTGENPFESILTPSTVGGLHELWTFDLGAVTIMQPVLATGVIVHGSPKDLVYMGAEHGDLYAIDVASGTMVWQRNLGSQQTSCRDMPDGVFGVSGSPFLDRTNNRMFVVAAMVTCMLWIFRRGPHFRVGLWPSLPIRRTSTRMVRSISTMALPTRRPPATATLRRIMAKSSP